MLARCIALGMAVALAAPVAAQAPYPNKPIKIIAPVQPGGGVDLVGRTIADRLGARSERRSSSTTRAAAAALSARSRPRAPRRTVTR